MSAVQKSAYRPKKGRKEETDRVATDGGYDRFPELTEFSPVGEKVALVHLGKLLVLHLFDVGARRKGLFGPGQDDASDRVVAREGPEGGVELVEQGRVERCHECKVGGMVRLKRRGPKERRKGGTDR